MDSFHDLGYLAPEILKAIHELGWTIPTPVQQEVIEVLQTGRDLIVQAQTGSGKTGAFGIPIIASIDSKAKKTQSLILVPTRELANQVCAEISQLSKYHPVSCIAIYGGVGYGEQLEGLEKGTHIIVGTPGRVLDHITSGKFKLDHIQTLVLDEADEMLSLGFWPDMQKIQGFLPRKRQSCLFSATMPERVRSLARAFLNDPLSISVSPNELAPQQIEHQYLICPQNQKESTLAKILVMDKAESAIIFCNTKDEVRTLTQALQRRNFNADQISGDLTQSAREKALSRIKSGKIRFLVATDVAARGIDISGLPLVVSYSAPETPDVYVHRTGRTGRAGKTGVAISLISGLDIANFRYLQNVLGIQAQERKLPKGDLPESGNDFQENPPEKEPAEISPREQLQKIVQPWLEKLSEEQRNQKIDQLLPSIQEWSQEPDGLKEITALCLALLDSDPPVPPRKKKPPQRRTQSNRSEKTGKPRKRRPPRRRD